MIACRHILIVHSAGDLGYLERLRPSGYRFTLIKKCPTDDDGLRFDTVIDWDYQRSVAETVDRVRRLHSRDPVHGVTSFSESGVVMAAILARELGLPGNPPPAALRARNKHLMRQAFAGAGMPNPAFHLVRSAREIRDRVGAAAAPMVLKPISGSSSYGVVKLQPDDSLEVIAAHLDEVRDYIVDYADENPQYPFEFWLPAAGYGIRPDEVFDPAEVFLLEGFIDGQQVSVDGFAADGNITCLGVIEIERIKDSDYFLEYEEWMPTRLGAAAEGEIERTATRAVQAVGLRHGCFHCELKVSSRGITVLELAARRGADNIADFAHRIHGVDVYEEGVRIAAGERRLRADLRPRGAMKMRYFLPETAGDLVAVQGADEVRRDPRVSELELECAPGDRILMPPDGYEFLGYLSVFGHTAEEAAGALEELYPKVRFLVAPGAPARATAIAFP